MRIGRRALLAGSALAAIAPTETLAGATARRRDVVDGFPMPTPHNALPDPLPQADPGRIRFEKDWLFHEGDIVPPPPHGHHETYLSVKAGNAPGAAAVEYDDGDWASVDLPHDWASFQPVVETANVSQGYRPRGIGWYRRRFRLLPEDRGKRLELHFDGIASHATVWINGSVAARSWSGYTSLIVDLTPFADYGEDGNVVSIRVDASVIEGWWYEGAGLYRHVWLVKRAPLSIATDGVHADPVRGDDGAWRVPVAVDVDSILDASATAQVDAVLHDATGRAVAAGTGTVSVERLARGTAAFVLAVPDPDFWSVERPNLYRLEVRLLRDGKMADRRRLAIGFRTVRFDAVRGLFLNDLPVKLKGVCLHQDHAGVGVAVPDALIAWRLERLKAMGCNAIRSSHNAPTAELLDLADRMGFLVMNENRVFNPSPDYLAQLEWLVRRDRNHPGVILWSVFNEEPMQGTVAGVEMVRRMEAAVRRLDPTRPVTAAMNGAFYDPVNVSQVVGVMGFNYYQDQYDRFHALNPQLPITSSEDTSAYQTRGAFRTDEAAHVHTSYDDEAAGWGATHRESWRRIAERPFVAGGFVWTGFDYHGEPTPHAWPTVSSFFGILDLCGFPKTAFDIRRAHWVDDAAMVSIAPHWNWAHEGEPIRIFTMSNADRVRLVVNGRIVGEKPVDRIMGQSWSVPFAPGRIEVEALRDGAVVARAAQETTGLPVALRLTPARTRMRGDGEDVQPVTIDAVDSAGRHVPTANLPVRLRVEGGDIIGLGNGDPNSHEPGKGNARSLFNGLAQAIVRAAEGGGSLRLYAEADGLRPAVIAIRRIAAPVPAQVPSMPDTMTIARWRRSPGIAGEPAATMAPSDGDNNSWEWVASGIATPPAPAEEWRVYRAVLRPRRRVASAGGTILLARIGGKATLWIDDRKVATKADPAPGALRAPLPPGPGPHQVALLVFARPDAPSGIMGRVEVQAVG